MSVAAWIATLLGAVLVVYVIVVFNRLVRLRNMTREGWSGIDVQLRRRADLIPNIVATVKGYAQHEQSVLEEVTARRAASMTASGVAEQERAEGALTGALGRLFAVAEAYPELRADANFRALQSELTDTEDHIQMARRYYNGCVRELNTLIESFPSVLVAKPFGFKQASYFALDSADQAAAPQVKLS